MNALKRTMAAAALAGAVATAGLADATVEQKTEFHLTGALGAMVNVFGGKAAREGLTSVNVVHGDRKSTNNGSNGTIVDLAEEKVYTVDYERKSYKVETFAEIRKRMEDARERAGKREADHSKPSGPEYDVDFNVKTTGAKRNINGWDTHEEVVTIVVHEKGMTVDQSGGSVLTVDLWMGPRVAAMRELSDFDARYFRKLYGGMFSVGDAQQMAMMLAASPAFGKAMKAFGEKSATMQGTAIRTEMKLETVTDPRDKGHSESSDDSSPAGLMGGLMSRMKKRHDDNENGGPTNRSTFFTSATEVLKADGNASAADVGIPAGFRQR